jgi:hypothetical protein
MCKTGKNMKKDNSTCQPNKESPHFGFRENGIAFAFQLNVAIYYYRIIQGIT